MTSKRLLYDKCVDYDYSLDDKGGKVLYVPLNVDTEFFTTEIGHPNSNTNPSPTLTVQVSSIDNDEGVIYSHPDTHLIARHPFMNEKFIGFQYLKDNGIEITYERKPFLPDKAFRKLPKLIFHLYGHFLVADLIRLFVGEYQGDIRKLITDSTNNKGIKQERRIRTYSRYGRKYSHYCPLDWLVTIENTLYQCCLELRCTSGLAGAITYKNLGILTDVVIPFKDLLSTVQKEKMKDTYLKNPIEFEHYALNDLKSFEMVKGFEKMMIKVQENIGLSITKSPRLTIGRTVANLVKQVLLDKVKSTELLSILTKYANSDYLKGENSTRIFLSKCDGGRAFNNRPLDTSVKKPIETDVRKLLLSRNFLCDVDINGAYGNGLCVQEYPLGIPMSYSHPLEGNVKYLSLKEFLQAHGDDLVDGLWIARVRTTKKLKFEQDLIPSWVIPPNKITSRKTDTEKDDETFESIEDEGYNKVFTNEIELGLINHDVLQWIDNICAKPQRRELLDNLQVINAMWYPKKLRVDTVEQVKEKLANHKGEHTSNVKGENLHNIENYPHSWTSFNLGDLLVKKLINERAKHPKKTPYNNLYKLIINTIYGDLVSPYFDIGNVVVGNNITARCRCMAWYLEKGLNAYQTITDGCVFDPSQVAIPLKRDRLTANNLVRGYSKAVRDRRWKTGVLEIPIMQQVTLSDGRKIIIPAKDLIEVLEDCEREGGTEREKVIRRERQRLTKGVETDDLAIFQISASILSHLKNLFPNVDVLHKEITNEKGLEQTGIYRIEARIISFEGIFQGTANYALKHNYQWGYPDMKPLEDIYKMRGYRKNVCLYIDDDKHSPLFKDDDYEINEETELTPINVPETFLNNLSKDLTKISRINPFIQEKILKVNSYKQGQKKLKNTGLEIGHTMRFWRLLTELTIGQFTFNSIKEFERIYKEHQKGKLERGQGYEGNFQNHDGTLNYQEMIEAMEEVARTNKRTRCKKIKHPYFEKFMKGKDQLLTTYQTET